MKEFLKNIIKHLFNEKLSIWLKKWNEWAILLPIASIILLVSQIWLYHLSGGIAATYDLGVTQKFIYAILTISIASGFASIVMKLSFPDVFDYLFHCLSKDWPNMPVRAKQVIAFSMYAFFIIMMVITIINF